MYRLSCTLLCGDLGRKFESSVKKESERMKALFMISAFMQRVVIECPREIVSQE